MCLLLPIFLLQNPFLALPGSSGGLTLQHSPSFRATVASSELLKFKNEDELECIVFALICNALLDKDFSIVALLGQPQRSLGRQSEDEALPPTEQVLSSSLWFRPPPAA